MTKEDVTNYTQMGVAGILTISLVVGFFMGLVNTEAFMAVAGGAIAYYFNDRKNTKELNATVEAMKFNANIANPNGEEI